MIPDLPMAWTVRRLRAARGLRRAEWTLVVVASATITAALVVRLLTDQGPPPWWPLFPIAAFLLAGATMLFLRRPTELDAAIALDRRLGLKECVSTAVALGRTPLDPGIRETLDLEARRRLGAVDLEHLRSAFPWPRPQKTAAALLCLGLAAWLLPKLPGPESLAATPAVTAAQKQREAQQVREAARRLEKRAEDLARALKRPGTESARLLARRAAQDARDLATRAPARPEALSRLSKLSDAVQAQQNAALLGTPVAKPFGGDSSAAELSALAELAARLDLPGLDKDLGRLADAFRREAAEARESGRPASVDHDRLEELQRRLEAAEALVRKLEELLAANPALKKRLEEALKRQQEALAKARRDLKRAGGA